MKKVLIVATVDEHIKKFHVPTILQLKKKGYMVDVASKGTDFIEGTEMKYNIPFERSPLKIKNLIALMQLKKIIYNNRYDIIHCHTPVGGVLTRIAALNKKKIKAKIIYTAHGFHFFRGAPKKNWLIFYPIEKFLSKKTDTLITINEEDYNLAKHKFKPGEIKLINGVGVNEDNYKEIDSLEKEQLRARYGWKNKYVLLYVAELSDRKNQDFLVESLKSLVIDIPEVLLVLVGTGDQKYNLIKKVNDLEIGENVSFLGYRNDVVNLMQAADVVVSSSKQEGLPVNIIEAMFTNCNIIVSNCRGNRDLIDDGENGFIFLQNNKKEFKQKVFKYYNSKDLKITKNKKSDLNKYSESQVLKSILSNYNIKT